MDNHFLRYSRQIFIEEIGVAGQRKIQAAKVLIIGAGGLGSPIIQYLAAAGVGTIALADDDCVEIHNLNRQVIHSEKNIGQLKVESAADFVNSINSSIRFVPIDKKVKADNILDLIKPYNIIIDGSDNFTTRYLVNDACLTLNKILVYGSIFSFEGQVAVFNYKGSKHLRHLFAEPPAEETQNCDANGVLGPLPGIVGSIMAMQTLQIITGLEVLYNQLLIINTRDWHFSKIEY